MTTIEFYENGKRKPPPRGSSLAERLFWYGWTIAPDGCWYWDGPVHTVTGYGIMMHDKVTYQVHRIAYSVWVGPIPEGLDVRHLCDHTLCINPECLEPGTHAQNMVDKIRTGRADKKLNAGEVQCIRDEYAKGVLSQYMLAEAFGIKQSTVSMIVNRRARKYV